ncbi:MAG: CBS domain-containing protein [Bryobacteraceae bacterium]
MPVADLCIREVVHTGRETTLHDAAQIMRQYHVGNLIVADRDGDDLKPVGIVTDRDIVLSAVAPGLDVKTITVGDLMGQALITVREGTGLFDCLQKMRVNGVRRLPIVNERGGLVGIITLDDVVELLAEEMGELAKLIARERGHEMRTRT